MMLTTNWFVARCGMLLTVIILLEVFNPLRCTLLSMLDLLAATSNQVAVIR